MRLYSFEEQVQFYYIYQNYLASEPEIVLPYEQWLLQVDRELVLYANHDFGIVFTSHDEMIPMSVTIDLDRFKELHNDEEYVLTSRYNYENIIKSLENE